MAKFVPTWIMYAIASFALATLLILDLVSKRRFQVNRATLMPLGPMYMPDSFPFAFPHPYNTSRKSLSMVQVWIRLVFKID